MTTAREIITRCTVTDLPADACDHCRTRGATSTYDAARNTWPAKVDVIGLTPRPLPAAAERPREPYRAPEVEDVHDPVIKVARDLTEILNMVPDLREAALDAISDDYLLGGIALVALAPIANPEDWERRFELRAASGQDLAYLNDHRDREQPPHQRIAWWSHHYRRTFGQDSDHLAVYETEVPFLRTNLKQIAGHDQTEFKAFAADINTARVDLENALHQGVRVHRSEVRCTNCTSGKRLVRVYADTAADDGYRCPNPACKAKYDADQFARARFQQMVSKNADRHVKSQDARDAIHRPPRTWRKWLRYGYVRSYRDPLSGQVWVWWPDVVQANDEVRRTERTGT